MPSVGRQDHSGVQNDTPEIPLPPLAVVPSEDLTAAVVAAWHAESDVAASFLHRDGGRCFCNYLAGLAVRTVLGV